MNQALSLTPSNTQGSSEHTKIHMQALDLLINIQEAQTSQENSRKVVYMGLCFLVLFTAFTSTQSLLSEIYDQLEYETLGQATLLALYGTFGIAVIIVPGMIIHWSYKKGIIIGSLGYLFTLVAGTITMSCAPDAETSSFCENTKSIYYLNISCAIVTGFCAAIIWLAVNRYITTCSSPSTRGRMMGTFFCLFSCSNVFGNVLAAVAVDALGYFNFFLIADIFAGIAVIMLIFAQEAPKANGEDADHLNVLDKAAMIRELVQNTRMRSFLLYMFFTGFVVAIYNSFEYQVILAAVARPELSELDVDARLAEERREGVITSLVFTIQAVMGIIASYSAGRLADNYKRSFVLNVFTGSFALAIVFSFISCKTTDLFYTYIMAGLWGFGYSGASTMIGIVMAKDFEGSIEAYAVSQLITNVATIVGFVLCIVITPGKEGSSGGDINNIITFLIVTSVIWAATQISTLFYKPNEDAD